MQCNRGNCMDRTAKQGRKEWEIKHEGHEEKEKNIKCLNTKGTKKKTRKNNHNGHDTCTARTHALLTLTGLDRVAGGARECR